MTAQINYRSIVIFFSIDFFRTLAPSPTALLSTLGHRCLLPLTSEWLQVLWPFIGVTVFAEAVDFFSLV